MATWQIAEPQRMTLDGAVSKLDVWLARGKVRVVATDGPARIDVAKVGRRGVTVTLDDGVLSVRHDLPRKHWAGAFWWFGLGRARYNAEVTIAVPPSVVGGLTVISGSVVASGLRQGATVDVTSGSITLMGLGGAVRAKTVSGSIEAMGVAGDLGLEAVSGEIILAESSAERVFIRTISGAVTCDLDNPGAHDVRISTTSGSITIRVPADADLDVSLNATSGRITSGFPQVQGTRMPGTNAASGRLGSGRGTLQAHAVSGSVALLSRPSESFAAPDESGSGGGS